MSLRDSIQDTSLELGQLENSAVQAAAVDQHAGLLKSSCIAGCSNVWISVPLKTCHHRP